MAAQRTETTTRAARKGNHPRAEVEVRTISTTQDALADINRFIQGQADQPDAPLQLGALLQDINGSAAMRRAARWTCVEGMPHRCMFCAVFFNSYKPKRRWISMK